MKKGTKEELQEEEGFANIAFALLGMIWLLSVSGRKFWKPLSTTGVFMAREAQKSEAPFSTRRVLRLIIFFPFSEVAFILTGKIEQFQEQNEKPS